MFSLLLTLFISLFSICPSINKVEDQYENNTILTDNAYLPKNTISYEGTSNAYWFCGDFADYMYDWYYNIEHTVTTAFNTTTPSNSRTIEDQPVAPYKYMNGNSVAWDYSGMYPYLFRDMLSNDVKSVHNRFLSQYNSGSSYEDVSSTTGQSSYRFSFVNFGNLTTDDVGVSYDGVYCGLVVSYIGFGQVGNTYNYFTNSQVWIYAICYGSDLFTTNYLKFALMDIINISGNGTTQTGNTTNGVNPNSARSYCFKTDVSYYAPSHFFDNYYNQFWEHGYLTGHLDGYDEGYDIGIQAGSAEVYQEGYNNGVEDGKVLGFGLGEAYGKTEGYQEGYADGLDDGYEANSTALTIFTGILEVGLLPVNVFLGILNFEVFGINIGGFASALLTISIVIIIIRFLFGGKNDK